MRKGITRRIIFELAYSIAFLKGVYKNYEDADKDNESYVRDG